MIFFSRNEDIEHEVRLSEEQKTKEKIYCVYDNISKKVTEE